MNWIKAHWIKAHQRITRKYNPDHMENDEWSDSYIEYSETDESIIEEGAEGDYSKVITIKTKLDNLTEQIIYDYLVDKYLKGCSCEHDCCGHYFGGLRKVHQISSDEFLLTTSYAPNY